MKLRYLLLAAALAFMPTAANAISLDADNNIEDTDLTDGLASHTYDVLSGPFFWQASFVASDNAGEAHFNFQNNSPDKRVMVTFSTVNQGTLFFDGGVTVSWTGGGLHYTPGQIGTVDSFKISTIIAASALDTLNIIWGDPKSSIGGRGDIDVTISAVPLPPAAMLLLSGLVGLGALGRFKRKAKPSLNA